MIGKSASCPSTSCPAPIRFAPSTTGYAHPGTLLSALFCWLEARSTRAKFIVRLENLDPERCKPDYESAMLEDLAWFGLDWDEVVYQSNNRSLHEAALDRLAGAGRLYPCKCSRTRMRDLNRRAPDGGFAYDNACRGRPLPEGGWRMSTGPLRVRLDDTYVEFNDLSGLHIRQHPASEMGDPIVRRRDGSIAYHLACIVDDHQSGVRKLIRGRDLASSAPVQLLMQELLGFSRPDYRHHFLFMEERGDKMAKFHGAVSAPILRKYYNPEELCGELASFAGMNPARSAKKPVDLLKSFCWERVRSEDLAISWDGRRLLPLLVPGR